MLAGSGTCAGTCWYMLWYMRWYMLVLAVTSWRAGRCWASPQRETSRSWSTRGRAASWRPCPRSRGFLSEPSSPPPAPRWVPPGQSWAGVCVGAGQHVCMQSACVAVVGRSGASAPRVAPREQHPSACQSICISCQSTTSQPLIAGVLACLLPCLLGCLLAWLVSGWVGLGGWLFVVS
jgi:hypothetical protein